jgi:glycosyltransferase involved in cell wall biosynthesis
MAEPMAAHAARPAMDPDAAASTAPALTFGLPVRNGAATVRRTLDSILAQDFTDLEVVVAENASTDDTPRIVREYAARDPRIRSCPADRPLSQIENFNRTFRLARGRHFRWIGCDDVVAPGYARRCLEALEAQPDAVGVTTRWGFVRADGTVVPSESRTGSVEGRTIPGRVSRYLELVERGRLAFDPMYAMYRRDALARTRLLRYVVRQDLYLPFEVVLQGPFAHVDELLATRGWREDEPEEVILARQHPGLRSPRHFGHLRMYLAMAAILVERRTSPATFAACLPVLAWRWAAQKPFHARRALRRLGKRATARLRPVLRRGGAPHAR